VAKASIVTATMPAVHIKTRTPAFSPSERLIGSPMVILLEMPVKLTCVSAYRDRARSVLAPTPIGRLP
jgi:hypothetical protein